MSNAKKKSHVILSTNNINVELILIYMYPYSIIIILNKKTSRTQSNQDCGRIGDQRIKHWKLFQSFHLQGYW